MGYVSGIMEFVNGPVFPGIVTALFLLSESLSLIPSIKANGVFQAIFNGLSALKSKLKPAV